MKILIINGPNLNMLGIREPGVYGNETLEDINKYIAEYAEGKGVDVEFFQSNCEGEIVSKLHNAHFDRTSVILNAGAYTHYSYAIRDAIAALSVPVAEVHLSDINSREEFRKISVIKDVCIFTVMGKGKLGYTEALDRLVEMES